MFLRKDKLIKKYGVTVKDAFLCSIIKRFRGSSKCPRFILNYSKKNTDIVII